MKCRDCDNAVPLDAEHQDDHPLICCDCYDETFGIPRGTYKAIELCTCEAIREHFDPEIIPPGEHHPDCPSYAVPAMDRSL